MGRIKTLIGRLFHVGYTVEGVWKLMRRAQVAWQSACPAHQRRSYTSHSRDGVAPPPRDAAKS